jgi:alkylated DNA repair dioxygenase AlkB
MWEGHRGNENGAAVAELPKLFADMYAEAVQRANRELKTPAFKKRKFVSLPEGKPNVGVVNFYPPGASMEPHQDTMESKDSIGKGYPVMGLCIGDACKLAYGDEAPKSSKTPKALRLESGDVYLFGGDARLLWHGVAEIFPRTAPVSLRLVPGRLNVTLRVM